MTKLKIGISPCPNDTFIFEAIYNKKCTLPDIEFEFIFEDIQKLNELASAGELDIIKVSAAHFFTLTQSYQILKSGGAMGFGVGPLLISKKSYLYHELEQLKIAIPGENTTAHFLLKFYHPNVQNKIPYSFEDIENAVLSNEVDAGVIIHENRFTYQEKGLLQLIDLGSYWETQTNLPIPLGGIVIKKEYSQELKVAINQLIQTSIRYAHQNQNELNDLIRCHAQEMSEDVMKKHIQLYVNDYSLDIGNIGKQAINKLYQTIYHQEINQSIFVE